MFKLTPEGRQRVDGNDVVRQTVPELMCVDCSYLAEPQCKDSDISLQHPCVGPGKVSK